MSTFNSWPLIPIWILSVVILAVCLVACIQGYFLYTRTANLNHRHQARIFYFLVGFRRYAVISSFINMIMAYDFTLYVVHNINRIVPKLQYAKMIHHIHNNDIFSFYSQVKNIVVSWGFNYVLYTSLSLVIIFLVFLLISECIHYFSTIDIHIDARKFIKNNLVKIIFHAIINIILMLITVFGVFSEFGNSLSSANILVLDIIIMLVPVVSSLFLFIITIFMRLPELNNGEHHYYSWANIKRDIDNYYFNTHISKNS